MAILVANSVGSLVIGVLYVMIEEKGILPQTWKPFLMVGLLGALTTFSTFSLDTIRLFEQGEWLMALVNVLSNVAISIASVCIGLYLGRLI